MRKKRFLKVSVILFSSLLLSMTVTGCGISKAFQKSVSWYDQLEKIDFSSVKERKADQTAMDGIQTLELVSAPLRGSDGKWIRVLTKVTDASDAKFHYSLKTDCGVADTELPVFQKSGNTLKLGHKENLNGADFKYDDKHTALLSVQIPKNYRNALNVEVDASAFQAERLQSSAFRLQCDAGQTDISSLTGGGSILVNVGQTTIDRMDLQNDLKLEVNAGQLSCSMAPDSKFDFQGEANAGTLKTDFATQGTDEPLSKRVSAKVNGGSAHEVRAQVKAGDLDLKIA